jgi:nicotinamidase-related amidase
MDINRSETAVLALHWQVDIVKPEGAFGPFFAEMVSSTGVIPRTANVLQGARAAGIPVIYTRVCFRPGYPDLIVNTPLFKAAAEQTAMIDGSHGASIIAELAPQAGDIVVDHRRVTGFYGSDLSIILKSRGIKTLVLAGVATNLTVEGTAREATNEGYNVIILADCCTAASAEIHRASLETLGLLTAGITNADDFLQGINHS